MRTHREAPLSPSTSCPYPMNRKEEIERALTTLSRRMALSGAAASFQHFRLKPLYAAKLEDKCRLFKLAS